MNFASRKKFSIYSLFYNSKTLHRYLFSILLILLILIFWFINFYKKLNSAKLRLTQEISLLNQKKDNLEKIKNETHELELNIDLLNKQLQEVVNTENNQIEDNLDIIIKSADNAQLLLVFCNNEEIVDKPFCSKSLVSFNLKGDFYQLLEFLNQLSSFKKLKFCKKFNIKKINDSELVVECNYKFYKKNMGARCADTFVTS